MCKRCPTGRCDVAREVGVQFMIDIDIWVLANLLKEVFSAGTV
jgi:hypothetical protein